MGQAALDFVQRFDLQMVLGEFEKELRGLAGEGPRGDLAREPSHSCGKLQLIADGSHADRKAIVDVG